MLIALLNAKKKRKKRKDVSLPDKGFKNSNSLSRENRAKY